MTISNNPRNSSSDIVASVGSGPCPGCEHWWTCKREHIACDAFFAYVTRSQRKGAGISRAPSKTIYLKIFNQAQD